MIGGKTLGKAVPNWTAISNSERIRWRSARRALSSCTWSEEDEPQAGYEDDDPKWLPEHDVRGDVDPAILGEFLHLL